MLVLLSAHLMAQNWALVPSNPSNELIGYSSIHARSNGRLTLTSGSLFQSTDGGTTINQYLFPGNASYYDPILFTDELHGYVGGGCWFPFDECTTGMMLTTTNGGIDWKIAQISSDVGIMTAISATNTGTVFTLGDYGPLFQYNATTSQWDSIYQFINGVNQGMQFLTDEVGYVQRSTYINGQHVLLLMKSTDGGHNWTAMSAANGIKGFHFINPNKGFVSFESDTLYRTLDGGDSFEPSKAFGSGGYISKIKFYDVQVGYALVDFQNNPSILYRTENGGDTWDVDFEVDSMRIQDISMVSQEEAYLIGNYTHIYHRTGMSAAAEPSEFSGLKIWPNPAKDVVNIESETAGIFTLYATDGRAVLSQNISGSAQINCADLPSGLYFYALNGRILGRLSLIQ